METIDAVVIGAGVVGLAAGRQLAFAGLEVLVLERHRRAGEETSSRNSGVIHSGIYYPAGSRKADLCVRGRKLLYPYCDKHGVAYQRCGKIIVAGNSQSDGLRTLFERGVTNGVDDLQWLSSAEVSRLEPLVSCGAGLLSPSTGVVDVHELMTAYEGDLQAAGGAVVFDSELQTATVDADGMFTLSVVSGGEEMEIRTRRLVNSAGLGAVEMLRKIQGYPAERLRKSYFAKGCYFTCQGAKPFKHLVYPMPSEAGLGVHATLDLDGSTRFGPDVEWVDNIDYHVDPRRADSFYAAIREYWPGLADGSLQPGYAGIRPKIVGPEAKAADFVIEGPREHKIPGLVNLLGIESPGLTSSLAIAEDVEAVFRG